MPQNSYFFRILTLEGTLKPLFGNLIYKIYTINKETNFTSVHFDFDEESVRLNLIHFISKRLFLYF